MAELLQDQDIRLLVDFYKCYRACVRAKVELIESQEKEVPAPKRKASRAKAKAYQRLALRYAITGNRPTVLITCGRIGSGKSTLAKKMAGILDCAYLCSDVIRKEKWGLPLFRRTAPEARNWLYTPEVTTQVYEHMLDQTLAGVIAHKSVVVDASFGQPRLRSAFMKALSELQVPFYFVEMQASDEEIIERLAKRETSSQAVSDARLEDFQRLSPVFQEPKDVPKEHLIRANSSGVSVDSLLENVLRQIQELNGRSSKRGGAAG
jgi:predicted kinase